VRFFNLLSRTRLCGADYTVHVRRLPLAILPLVLIGCSSESPARQAPAEVRPPSAAEVRQPSAAERHAIFAVAKETYAYESGLKPYDYRRLHLHLPSLHLHPRVARIRVSQAKPTFATAVVELRDARGRRRAGTLVLVLRKIQSKSVARDIGPWELLDKTAAQFTRPCTRATPQSLRALVCPDPWKVAHYRRPRIRLDRGATTRLRSADLHAVHWNEVVLPGAACGAARPIRLRRHHRAFVRSALEPWWPLVEVFTNGVSYGDLDGDGRDEAAITVVCSNGGGTGGGQLGFAAVVFAARGNALKVVGIIAPRQPLVPGQVHVPVLGRIGIQPGKLIAQEAWYGRNDGTCCASGRATTLWKYTRSSLRPSVTAVQRPPRR
jgi:hypothetical protein